MAGGPAYNAFKLAFQASPIVLVNGITSLMTGSMLPIISFTEAVNFLAGVLGNNSHELDVDKFFATFEPMPGATLIDNAIGTYPFANQAVAANAIIAQPLTISMRMLVPVRQPGGYAAKLATMMALQAVLARHNNLGGTYVVITPSFFYTDCIMTRMVDITGGESKQRQTAWQLEFAKPLLTVSAAEGALNALMTKVAAGVPIDGLNPAWSGVSPSVGIPSTAATPSLVTAAANLPAAGPATIFGAVGSIFR